MKLIWAVGLVLLWASTEGAVDGDGNVTGIEGGQRRETQLLSRRKRYIVFPAGSSLQLILELLVHVPTQFRVVVGPTLQVAWPLPSDPPGSLRFGMTVGLAWQLPDDPMIYSEFKKKHKVYKRNVFKKMEAFMTKPWGANGRQCVLKALCESGQRTPSKKEFATEILHKIFSVEAEEPDLEENHEDKVYRKAHQSVNQNCNTLYPECDFSFFNSAQ